jgi:hypothetical protein
MTTFSQFLTKKHPAGTLPLSPGIAFANLFLFPTLKRELSGLTLSLDEMKFKNGRRSPGP